MRHLIILTAFAIVAACATGATGPGAADRFDSFRATETRDFRGYDKVYLAPPVAGPEVLARVETRRLRSNERPIGARDITDMLGELNEDLERELGRVAELVDGPGPGILTVRTTLTDLNANRPTQTELAMQPGLTMNSIASGDSAVQIQLLEDGRLLAEIRDRDNIDTLIDQGVINAGVWVTARQHFSQVASRLAALLSD